MNEPKIGWNILKTMQNIWK